MLVSHALHQRQARAVALELVRAMQPLEDAEQLAGEGHPEPDPVVLDGEAGLALVLDRPDRDDGVIARAGELERVREQPL